MPDKDRNYHVFELAFAVGRKPRTIYRAIARGEIRAIRWHRILMIPASEFERIKSQGLEARR